MPENSGPRIQPSVVPIAGVQITVVADADPETFVNGLELMVTAPGRLEAIGTVLVPRGAMVAIVPVELANHMRSQMRRQAQAAMRAAAAGQRPS